MYYSTQSSGNFLSNTPEEKFTRRKIAIWLLALQGLQIPVDDDFFNCAGWVCGGLPAYAQRLKDDIKLPKGRTNAIVRAREALKEINVHNHGRLDDMLADLYSEHPLFQDQLLDLTFQYFGEIAAMPVPAAGNIVLKRLKKLFDLDKQELDLCFYAFTVPHYRPVESYLEDTLEIGAYSHRHLMAKMFGMSVGQIVEVRSKLANMGILDSPTSQNPRLNDNVEEAVISLSGKNSLSTFCSPMPKTDIPLEQFNIPEEVKNHVIKLMSSKSSRPVNILLYGAPGSGKTSFASCLAKTLGVKAWAVRCGADDDTQDRRASLSACLKVAQNHARSFVLVDEAERLLDTDNADLREGSSKAWVNNLLERKNTRIIWITNRVHHLDQAVRRRFSFSIHFDAPGPKESLTLWNTVAKNLGLENKLSVETRERFAKQYKVSVATIELALRQARANARQKDFADWVERTLKAHVTLSRDGHEEQAKVEAVIHYDPECVCATISPARFLEKAAFLAKRLDEDPMPGMGAMLFYGPPGTGKTELAKQLARSINKEILVRRASDLLDPYVGMTEQKIAEAFREAARNDYVLLIDEADSFIFNRESASRSWEVTMVNEFLGALEDFRGICICTTNFRSHLDAAVMRRFPTKLEFSYAKAEQIERLYANLLRQLTKEEPDEGVLRELMRQKHLAPGDFMAVKRKMWLEDQPTQAKLLAALLEEQKLKLESGSKSVGF